MMQNLSPQERLSLKSKGFSDKEIDDALRELEMEDIQKSYGKTQSAKNSDPRMNAQQSSFSAKIDENLVRWQLELNDILEKAEHILRGDIPTFEKGFIIFKKNPKPNENVLNEKGVQEVMKALAMYVNRNTILSDFEQEEIDNKALEFGKALNNLLFMKYEEFGIDTEEKMKNYPILVLEVVDMVHASLKRALKGGERKSLREMIQISQSTQGFTGAGGVTVNATPQMKTRGIFNPMRYFAGKYK